ncbi:hypothetical protein PR048_032245 [Dryococelus australis]|uniref:HAT C-terminal dimerisation domain-containing protein n=1 Tax=Dryococelus australis TaxID=614101 RepID=A0ABQ9G2W0_9NEOP|nr:hypothetical protein PR048_032245 [Dryococelus australis]
MKRSHVGIDNYFKRVAKEQKEVVSSSQFTNSSTLIPKSSDFCSPVVSIAAGASSLRAILDISIYIGKTVDDFTKRNLLQDHWRLPEEYAIKMLKGKEVHRHPTHLSLEMFEWLAFSDISQGLPCKYRALFVPGHVGGLHKTVQLSQLVTRPLTQFSKLLGKDRQLVGLCETRRAERHDSSLQFCKALSEIAAALECVSMWEDSGSASKAKSLQSAISESDFIAAVVSLSDLLITTLQLSRILQKKKKKTLDLKTAEEMLCHTIITLKAKRGNCEQGFLRLLGEARDIALELGTELKASKALSAANTGRGLRNGGRRSIEEDSSQKAVIEFLSECDRDAFPVISTLLRVLATLPVSEATAERTFSTLKRIKTWLTTTMSEDRLIGLALLATHRDISINPDQVTDRFAMSGNRRLKFV